MTVLRDHLMNLNTDLLKGWLRRMDISMTGFTRKEQFADLIESQIKGHLSATLERLSSVDRDFLAECVHQGRMISAAGFEAKYGVSCPQPTRHFSYRDKVQLLTPFIVRETSYDRVEQSHIAEDLVAPLRALLPAPTKVQARVAGHIPKTWENDRAYFSGGAERVVHTFEGERIGPAELDRVLRLVQGGKVKTTDSTKRPTEATAKLVSASLLELDFALEVPEADRTDFEKKYDYTACGFVRSHAWPVVLQQCGWAKARGGTLTLTDAGKDLLRQFDVERFRDGVDELLDDSEFDELQRINHIRGQSGKAKRWITEPSERKRAIVSAMAGFPVGEWLKFEEARRLIEASGEPWNIMEGDGGFLYFFDPQYGFICDDPGLRSQFLRAFMMETAATLGLVDIAYVYPHRRWPDLYGSLNGDLPFCGRYDGLLYVRINPLGAYVLGLSEGYDFRPAARQKLFRVLPNLDLVLDGQPLNPADRAGMELLAVPQSEAVWKLDSERILTHIEAGGSFASLREFLAANTASDIPENVTVFLDGLEAKFGACRSRRAAVLLEWAEPALAQLIATSSGFKRLCHYAGENRLVVPAENLSSFTRALKRLGYVLPRD
jgi:hypothetical protein